MKVTIRLGFDKHGTRYYDDCESAIIGSRDGFVLYEFADGRATEITCTSCAGINVDELIKGYELFECSYCGVIHAKKERDTTRPGIVRCKTCRETRRLLLAKAAAPVDSN